MKTDNVIFTDEWNFPFPWSFHTKKYLLSEGRICGEKMEGLNIGLEAADWLEEALGIQDLR